MKQKKHRLKTCWMNNMLILKMNEVIYALLSNKKNTIFDMNQFFKTSKEKKTY